MAPHSPCEFKFSLQNALFILSLPWLQAEASVKASAFCNPLLQGPTGTQPSALGRTRKRRRDQAQTATSFWELREETDILKMEIEYPGHHPHERHLSERERKLAAEGRYDLEPIDHDGSGSSINGGEIPSTLRDPANDLTLPPQIEFDDDFERAMLEPYFSPFGDGEEQPYSYEPLRIHFITTPLERKRGQSAHLDRQIDELLETALPAAAEKWSAHLLVYPVLDSIRVPRNACYGSFVNDIRTSEVSDADLVIIVSAYNELGTMPVCGGHSLALGASCALDQWDRPVIGFINVCLKEEPDTSPLELDDLVTKAFKNANGFQPTKLPNATVPEDHQRVDPTTILVHELAHTLGFDSYLFKFFRNGTTGEPLTPRPFGTALVQCPMDDHPSEVRGFPSDKVLKIGLKENGETYFDIVTPRVAQVARNHFDCQSLAGARLENFESTCVGSHWDERLFLTDILSPALAWRNNLLSPLTLALLEDTGWYHVNYENVTVPSFGLGAGCDFVEKPCIQNDRVPSYAQDYFCDNPIRLREGDSFDIDEESWRKITCDPTHQYW